MKLKSTKFIIILMYIVLASSTLFAQGRITGVVTDASGLSVPGAYVSIKVDGCHDMTNVDGAYRIHNVPEGKHELLVSYIGYQDLSLNVTVVNGAVTTSDIILSDGNQLAEVIINGRLEGQAKAYNTQKNKLNITEVLDAEQIERFPDANLGDALKRLAGVNVQYDQGEARFANIRGTAPELNSITVNGERIPSAEAEKRFVQLDLIPSDMVSSVEVNKAVTPDMDGDAIGGSINLVTQKAKTGTKIKGTLGSGYSLLTEKPLFKGKLAYSDRFAGDRVGVVLTASALQKPVRSDNIEAEWDYTDEENKDASAVPTDIQVRQYELERLRQSYAATLDYDLSTNHNIYITGMYTKRNDWENRYRLRYKDIEMTDEGYVAEIRRQTKGGSSNNKSARLEDQRTYSLTAGGEHFFGKLKAKWSLSSLSASEDRPNERYISMKAKDQLVDLDLNDLTAPSVTPLNMNTQDLSDAYGLNEITEENQFTEEKDINGRLDLELPVFYGANSSFLKFGGRFKTKSKMRNNNFTEYESMNEDEFIANTLNHTLDKGFNNFSHEGYHIGSFVSEDFLGKINFSNQFVGESVIEELAGNFEAEEDVYAGYVMYTQNIGKKTSVILGARYEQTKVNYAGKIFDGETLSNTEIESDSYSNFLPGVHVKYSPSKWSNIKLAWTNTIARPNYFDLVPYQQIETEDNEIQVGNPSLEATTSMNFDLLGEYYFRNLGILSGGVFYKDLNNIIADKSQNDYEFQGNVYDKYTQPVNAGNASLLGYELGLSRRLDFLPSVLSNLTVYGNYTYTKSVLKDITLEGRESEDLPLVGTPSNLMNLSLSYDNSMMDVRVSYNFAGAFIEEYNDETFFDRWYGDVSYLDINANVKLNKKWTLYASANNLLNTPLRYYQGVEARTMQEEYYGVQTRIGVKYAY